MYEVGEAVDRLAAARAAIDAVDPAVMLIGRNENFRVPDMPVKDSIARAVAYAEAGADCLFVPFILDTGAVAELVAAVSPKPLNVVIHDYPGAADYSRIGVRRCSVGGNLAKRTWDAFDAAAAELKASEP
jgi:2-methylisocitrate lyase-like PEP mutase family enzyme